MDCPDGFEVDHIHGENTRNDNRKSNLRIVTKSENGRNKGLLPSNTSGITGVSWDKNKKKWGAYITYLGKHYFLGYAETVEEAAELRRCGEIKYFGEFSFEASQNLNRNEPEYSYGKL